MKKEIEEQEKNILINGADAIMEFGSSDTKPKGDEEMNELKTLKDLPEPQIGSSGDSCVNINELKQEAINWINGLNKLNKDNYEQPRGYKVKDFNGLKDVEIDWEESSEIYGMIKILTHFFNITEEDLK
jgi:hypothetical protein